MVLGQVLWMQISLIQKRPQRVQSFRVDIGIDIEVIRGDQREWEIQRIDSARNQQRDPIKGRRHKPHPMFQIVAGLRAQKGRLLFGQLLDLIIFGGHQSNEQVQQHHHSHQQPENQKYRGDGVVLIEKIVCSANTVNYTNNMTK